MENIVYNTDAIAAYFGENRRRWEQFYPSERWIIDHVAERRHLKLGQVLDVGCACGGLGAALCGRYDVAQYTGIDINAQAIAVARAARDLPVSHHFIRGDVARESSLAGTAFDLVFNLSCADWNVDFGGILAASWERVAPGGTMIISLRLSDLPGERDMTRSYQFIHYGDADHIPVQAERAAYVVLNISEALGEIALLAPSRIIGYGYWAPPSRVARTPYKRLAFSVFAIDRPTSEASLDSPTILELHLPVDIWRAPGSVY